MRRRSCLGQRLLKGGPLVIGYVGDHEALRGRKRASMLDRFVRRIHAKRSRLTAVDGGHRANVGGRDAGTECLLPLAATDRKPPLLTRELRTV